MWSPTWMVLPLALAPALDPLRRGCPPPHCSRTSPAPCRRGRRSWCRTPPPTSELIQRTLSSGNAGHEGGPAGAAGCAACRWTGRPCLVGAQVVPAIAMVVFMRVWFRLVLLAGLKPSTSSRPLNNRGFWFRKFRRRRELRPGSRALSLPRQGEFQEPADVHSVGTPNGLSTISTGVPSGRIGMFLPARCARPHPYSVAPSHLIAH